MARLVPLAMIALLVPLFGGSQEASAAPIGPSILVTISPSGGFPSFTYTGPASLHNKWYPQSVIVTWKCIPGSSPIDYKKTTLGNKPLFTMNQTLNTTGNWTASIGPKVCTDGNGATATAGPVKTIHIDRSNPLIQTAAVVECRNNWNRYCQPNAFNSDTSEAIPFPGPFCVDWGQLSCLKSTWPAVSGVNHTVGAVAVIFECTDVQGDINKHNPYHTHYWQAVKVTGPVTNVKVFSNGTAWCKNKAGLEALVPGKFQYLTVTPPLP